MVIICRVVARAVTSILVGYYLLNPITSCTILTSGAPPSTGLQYKGPVQAVELALLSQQAGLEY